MKKVSSKRSSSLFRNATVRKGLLTVLAAALPLVAFFAAASWAGVAATKHNLGKYGPGPVKTLDTSEVCVFCHTPHNSSPSGPLWNRADSGATYNVYQSQTLAATLSPNSPTLGQPTGSSKLCLSCHDGTIALGALLNLPGATLGGTLQMQTTPEVTAQGMLSPNSTAYIGTDLRDDHPISFDYSRSYPANTELKDSATFPPEVKLDSTNKLQCTSCHNPHGTAFPKFLVASLQNSALCTICHDKRYWSTNPAVHSTSTVTWNGLGQNPWHVDLGNPGYSDDNPSMHGCLSCHRSHGGAAGKMLLKGVNPSTQTKDDEEWTCLVCHNGNAASKNIEALLNYTYKHDVKGVYGAHTPSRALPGDPARESASSLGINNRHAECVDCHNPHGAMSGSTPGTPGNHAMGGVNGNIIGPNLLGGWGVRPVPWPTAGNAATTYQITDFTSLTPGAYNLEGYLCLKCHSYYAYANNPPFVPSGNADGSPVLESDPTADFNINNMSFHPVFATGKNNPPVTANPNWPANTLGLTNTFRYAEYAGLPQDRSGFYNITHNSTITCTDCHGSSEPLDPKGPHGSYNKWILRSNETGVGTAKNFCYNCHRRDVYGDEGYVGPLANYSRVPHPVDGLGANSPFYKPGVGTGNNSNKFGILCLTCHGGAYDNVHNMMKGIHGSNAAAGTQLGSDPLGYRMMNGACVESYKRATTTTGVQMWFRTVDPATDPVCANNFASFTGNTATYDCNNIADCSF